MEYKYYFIYLKGLIVKILLICITLIYNIIISFLPQDMLLACDDAPGLFIIGVEVMESIKWETTQRVEQCPSNLSGGRSYCDLEALLHISYAILPRTR